MGRKRIYTDEELAIIKDLYLKGYNPTQIEVRLRELGYKHKATSIATKINRLRLFDLKK